MSKDKKMIPKLRFPEFGNEGKWEEKTVGEVYEFMTTNSFSRENLNYQKGTVKNIHYGDIHTRFNTLFDIQKEKVPYLNKEIEILNRIKEDSYCIEGDIVFADASEDLDDIGKSIEIVNLNNEKLVSGLHTLLARQKARKLSIGFGGYLFKSDSIRSQIQREAQGAKVLGISKTRISNVEISYPKTFKEQQKIVSCLSSFDEVIAAHSQKLDSLKEHKKALMQNLFPRKGENVPKYRFSEFAKNREWQDRKLGDICDMQAGKFVSGSEINSSSIENQFPCYGGNGLRGFTKTYTHQGRYSLIGRQGALCGNITLATGTFHATEHAVVVSPRKDIDTIWLYYLLNLLNLNKYATGQAQPGLSVSNLEQVEVIVPNEIEEQQRIAFCLFSLDELITDQTEKIEYLKLHKKGLMKGLFPKMND
jgi:type I restriction enzyme S subunit